MSEIAARIAAFFTWISTLVPALITPNWAALIGLLPLFVAPLVLLWLLSTGGIWTLVGITKRGAQLKVGTPLPIPAPLGTDGQPHFPAGRPYAAREAAIYPNGSTRSINGEPLMIACPSCAFELADGSAFCSRCGTKLVAPLALAEAEQIITTLRPEVTS